MTCRIDEICSDFETTRTWSKSKLESRSSNQVRLGLLQQELWVWSKSRLESRSSIKLTFQATDSEVDLISSEILIKYDMWKWSNFTTKHWLIETQRVDRQSDSFFVVVLSSTDLCVHWSVLIHLYSDDTIQVSILYVKFTVEWWYEISLLSDVWSI
jgi:hypothetical protein